MKTVYIVINVTENVQHAKHRDYGSLLKKVKTRKRHNKRFINLRHIDRNDTKSSIHKEPMKLQEETHIKIP